MDTGKIGSVPIGIQKVVLAVANSTQKVSNGLKCDDMVIGISKNEQGEFTAPFPQVVEAPGDMLEDFAVGKYKYVDGKFLLNENHIATEQEKIEELQSLLDAATSLLVEGGVL